MQDVFIRLLFWPCCHGNSQFNQETYNSASHPPFLCSLAGGHAHSSCFWCHAVHRHEWAFCEQSFINVPVGGLHTSGPNLIGRGKRCSNVACKDSPVALYLHLAAIMWCPFICSHDALREAMNHFRDCEQRRSASAPAVVRNWIPPGLFFFSMLF